MKTEQTFIRIAGVCAIIAPLVLLASDLLQIAGLKFEMTVVAWLSFVFLIPAIFGLTYLCVNFGSRLALFGGALTFFGAMAGAAMQVLFRVWAVLEEKNSPQTVELLKGSFKLIALTQMIGIFFPIGLLILSICLYLSRAARPIVSLALAAGAILFPVGRIGGFWWAFLSSDVLLIVAFGLIGWRLFSVGVASLENENEPA